MERADNEASCLGAKKLVDITGQTEINFARKILKRTVWDENTVILIIGQAKKKIFF